MRPWREWIDWARERGWRWPELPVLAIVLLLGATAWLFVELADEVVSGDTRFVDQLVVDLLRDPQDSSLPRGPKWFVDAARDVTALGSTAVLFLVVSIAVGYMLLEGQRRMAMLLVGAVVSGVVFSASLKYAFDRPRPPDGSAVQSTATASFPSGHSFSSAVVYLTLGALSARLVPKRRVRAYLIGVALFLTLAVGLSRVYLGVHYPSDVLAGWTSGAGWAMLWWLIARYAWPSSDE